MNLVTINLTIGTLADGIAILVYLWKGVRFNKARNKAQQGRITAIVDIVAYQSQRMDKIEKHMVETTDFQLTMY